MGRRLVRHLGRRPGCHLGHHLGRWLLPAACLGLACSNPTLAACGDAMPAHTRLEAQAGGLRLLAAPRPWPGPVGQHVALDILLCAAPGSPLPQSLQVDAEMPAHRHGMNYRATVRPLGGGRWAVGGLWPRACCSTCQGAGGRCLMWVMPASRCAWPLT